MSPNPSHPTSDSRDGDPACSPILPCISCAVRITPNPLELYVSEPDAKLRTLSAVYKPSGGSFTWTSSDPAKLTISGSGSSIAVKGLDEGDFTVSVEYKPPTGPACSAQATVKIRYEVRHILVAQGLDFNNAQLALYKGINRTGDTQIPNGYLSDNLSAATPFPIEIRGTSATFKSVKQGVKYTIDVTTDRTEFKRKLETPEKPGTKELEYWHIIYLGHSRYGRGACFGIDNSHGEDWENGSDPAAGTSGLYRMGYPFVGVPIHDILHYGYHADLVSAKVSPKASDREDQTRLQVTTLAALKHSTKRFIAEHSGDDRIQHLQPLDSLDTQLRIVRDRVGTNKIGDALKPDDTFWTYSSDGEPNVLLQAGWKETVTKPMDLGATDMKCRVFCHFGCQSWAHYGDILRLRKSWKKAGNTDRFAYFTTDVAYAVTVPFWLYYLLTYDKFNAGKPWEPSLKHARERSTEKISVWCLNSNIVPYEIM